MCCGRAHAVRWYAAQYYCHVLNKYSDAELQAVMDVAIGKQPYHESSVISVYKEVQVRAIPAAVSAHRCGVAYV